MQFIGKPEPTDSRHGLVFRAFLYLFQLLQERKDTNFVLKASFLEIYNEKVSTMPSIICTINNYHRIIILGVITEFQAYVYSIRSEFDDQQLNETVK